MRRERTSTHRKLSIYGFELVGGGHNFYALLEFDITKLRSYLRERRRAGDGGSFFAYMLKAIGTCVSENLLFNSFIDLRSTTRFEEVDINIPVEIRRDGAWLTKQCIIRNIGAKSLAEVNREIEAAKDAGDAEVGFVASKATRALLGMLPAFIVRAIFRIVLSNHAWVQKFSGTLFVTSVSMFSNVPGFVIPYIGGPKAVSFAIGSIAKKPVVVGNRIEIREMVSITAIFNHDLVDGAPAARFINRLRELVEADFQGAVRPDGGAAGDLDLTGQAAPQA